METHKKLFNKLREARASVSYPKPGDKRTKDERVSCYNELDTKWKKLLEEHLSSMPEMAADEFTFTIDDQEEDAPCPGRRARRTAAHRAASQKKFDEMRAAEAAKMRAAAAAKKPKPKPKREHNPPFECRRCDDCFLDKDKLIGHLKDKHPLPPRLIKCAKCGSRVANIGDHVHKEHPVPKGCVACKKCHMHVLGHKIGLHLATKCPKADGTCRHCGKKDRRDRIVDHTKVCTSNPKNQRVAGGAGGAGGPSPSSNPFSNLVNSDE